MVLTYENGCIYKNIIDIDMKELNRYMEIIRLRHSKITAEVSSYPELYKYFIQFQYQAEFVISLYDWLCSDIDDDYFSEQAKRQTFNHIKSYITITKELMLAEWELKLIEENKAIKLGDSGYEKLLETCRDNTRITSMFASEKKHKVKTKTMNV